jgi:hypothetical protein
VQSEQISKELNSILKKLLEISFDQAELIHHQFDCLFAFAPYFQVSPQYVIYVLQMVITSFILFDYLVICLCVYVFVLNLL